MKWYLDLVVGNAKKSLDCDKNHTALRAFRKQNTKQMFLKLAQSYDLLTEQSDWKDPPGDEPSG
jgi:hypothetical protein